MKNELEDFLRSNRDHVDQKTPDPLVLNRILQQMHKKNSSKPGGVFIPFQALKWAAACLILVAVGTAYWAHQKRPDNLTRVKPTGSQRWRANNQVSDSVAIASGKVMENRQEKPKSVDIVEEDLVSRKQALIAAMKLNTLNSAKRAMYAGLNNMESPASRINAAYNAHKLKNTGHDVVDALTETLNTDPSANVRLAALDGLTRFYRDSYVRGKLVASLKKQHDPVVQITLINLLTRMRESGILEDLNQIINDGNTMKAVKDCAYSSIFRLRSS